MGKQTFRVDAEVKLVLGIDPGTTSLGWAIGAEVRVPGYAGVKRGIVDVGTIRPGADHADERITQLIEALSRLWLDKGPFSAIVAERASGFRGPRGYIVPVQLSALMARIKTWADQQVQVAWFVEYHPSTVRAAVVTKDTNGQAVKARIKAGVLAQHPALVNVKASQDALDAVAVLICHWNKTGA